MAPSASILVLGASGMLGSTVVRRLRATHPAWRIDGASRDPVDPLKIEVSADPAALTSLFARHSYNLAINCVGVLKDAIDQSSSSSIERAVQVNALFPHTLAEVAGHAGARVIHVSTDAVFSGRKATPYDASDQVDPTDFYGMTKALGESPASHVINVRCSLVGRDSRGRGLVEWYLRAAGLQSVAGFQDYVWTPVTTVGFADFCGTVVDPTVFTAIRGARGIVHLAPYPAVSKYHFLESLRDIAGGGAAIDASLCPGGPCRRVLAQTAGVESTAAHRDLKAALRELMIEFSSVTANP
jgi:dTDP-4-dehydrorhamnose reductase